ncbi:Pre-mRNA-splicing factor 38A [Rhynchospora pubera]|uniref:Pre-mRNA-splicing factor 38 n=1 Tax=Rhynchospora pubera TaxID=906938 RepID=A0AAV8EC40_9POAL|nr:Pre-mRNA-splicing factor 38A [Rhynchospora pubera]
MDLNHLGGTFGGARKPTPFLCLLFKMLQIQLNKDIVVEFIKNEDYKYVRVLGAFYLRLTASVSDVYLYLEPLYNDYHKLNDGSFSLTHVDEFIDEILTIDYSCNIALPHVQKRSNLEAYGILDPRRSALEDDFEEDEEDKDDNHDARPMDTDDRHKEYYRGRSLARDRERDRDRERQR